MSYLTNKYKPFRKYCLPYSMCVQWMAALVDTQQDGPRREPKTLYPPSDNSIPVYPFPIDVICLIPVYPFPIDIVPLIPIYPFPIDIVPLIPVYPFPLILFPLFLFTHFPLMLFHLFLFTFFPLILFPLFSLTLFPLILFPLFSLTLFPLMWFLPLYHEYHTHSHSQLTPRHPTVIRQSLSNQPPNVVPFQGLISHLQPWFCWPLLTQIALTIIFLYTECYLDWCMWLYPWYPFNYRYRAA